jgi:competence ComEA-like helix-hairpin-helix protein
MSAGLPVLGVATPSPGGQPPSAPLLGVPTANPTPPVTAFTPRPAPQPQRQPVSPETSWPASAQWATAALLGLALLLLGWHSYQAQPGSARPTTLRSADDQPAAPDAAGKGGKVLPRQGSPASPTRPAPAPRKSTGNPATGKKVTETGEVIDLNEATLQELQRLPGIGPTLATRIVEQRDREPFQAVEDLRRVKGIGARTLDKLRPYVAVGSTSPPADGR